MLRSIVLIGCIAAPLLYAFVPTAESQVSIAPVGCPNTLTHEPLVIYDVTGFTFAGGLRHLNLVVYSDGFATIVKSSTVPTVEDVDTAFLSPNDARQLIVNLTNSNAFSLCDQNLSAADIPLTTVTVIRGNNGISRSFSYWVPTGAYAPIQGLIEQFIADHFPGF